MYFNGNDGTLCSSSTIPKEFKDYADYAANTFLLFILNSLNFLTYEFIQQFLHTSFTKNKAYIKVARWTDVRWEDAVTLHCVSSLLLFFMYSRALSFSDSVTFKFTWHCLNPRGGKKTFLWAFVIPSSTLPFLLILFFSPLFLPPSFLLFSAISHFIFYSLLLILSSHLSSLTGSTPFLCLPSSPSISAPPSFERLLFEPASWTQSLFYGE